MNAETKPIIVAVIRGLATAIVMFGLVTLGTYQTVEVWSDAIIAGGIAGLTVIATRIGVEGVIDQRATRG